MIWGPAYPASAICGSAVGRTARLRPMRPLRLRCDWSALPVENVWTSTLGRLCELDVRVSTIKESDRNFGSWSERKVLPAIMIAPGPAPRLHSGAWADSPWTYASQALTAEALGRARWFFQRDRAAPIDSRYVVPANDEGGV